MKTEPETHAALEKLTEAGLVEAHGKIHRYDAAIAKNYLSEFELAQMQRIVQDWLFESDFDRLVKQLEAGDET